MKGLLEGIALGLTLCILIGPIFFKILQTSIERGWRAGLSLAAGQWLSDLMYIALVSVGMGYIQQLLDDPILKRDFVRYVGSAGGIVVAVMGILMLISKPKTTDVDQKPDARGYVGLWIEGFLINTINPFPLFFWMTLMGTALAGTYSQFNLIGLFAGTMLTVIGTDLLKVYLAKWISHRLTPKHVLWMRRIAGVCLLGFALLLLWQSWAG